MSTMATTREKTSDKFSVKKIEPAYKQVADQIRKLILDGALLPGEQLPVEDKLGANFGVSRNTVREALRMLSSQNLVETTRGVSGGTFVSMPTPELLQSQIEASLGLLRGLNSITAEELLETRFVLEVPGSRWAAERRTDEHLERMRIAANRVEHGASPVERSDHSQDFHQAVLDAAGNRLLSTMGPPILRSVRRGSLELVGVEHTWPDIDHDHLQILEHIEAQRPDEAAEAMRLHLTRLRDNNL